VDFLIIISKLAIFDIDRTFQGALYLTQELFPQFWYQINPQNMNFIIHENIFTLQCATSHRTGDCCYKTADETV